MPLDLPEIRQRLVLPSKSGDTNNLSIYDPLHEDLIVAESSYSLDDTKWTDAFLVDDGSFSMVLVPQSLLMTWVEY